MTDIHPDWPIVEFVTHAGKTWAARRHLADLVALGNYRDLLHVILCYDRPGSLLFSSVVEWTLFPPDPREGNRRFRVHSVRWHQDAYGVISVPLGAAELVRELAAELTMRLADGVPHLIEGADVHRFPLCGPTAYALEWAAGSPLYALAHQPGGLDRLHSRESELIDLFGAGRDNAAALRHAKADPWTGLDQDADRT